MADLVRRPGGASHPPADGTGLAGFRRNRPAVMGALVLVAVTLAALLAPLLAPWDPAYQGDLVTLRYTSPSWAHPLGTDHFARDVLSRLLFGARVSLSVGILAVTLSVVLGTVVGSVAGFLGGWIDTVAMRGVDVVLAFPRIVLLVVLVAVFEPSLTVVVLVLGLTQWPVTARIVRGEVLSLREREFILAARALGFSRRRILVRHLIPNALAPVIVTAALGVGHTIVLEAGLSFLGIGVQPPTPSWGGMVESGRDVMVSAWWLSTFPGLAIVLTVVAFNLVGDGLRDALDPRLDR
jgi:peptide/nickel transport system permease protein